MLLFYFSTPALALSLVERSKISLDLGGYYKNLFFTSKRQATGDFYLADLNRFRLEWDAHFLEKFSANVVWDQELIGGNYIATEEFATRQANRNIATPDLEYQLHRSNHLFYGQNFYRAYLQYKSSWMTVTVGRQRVDWGVMRINPITDLFIRPPIFDVEKDEVIAPVAANLQIPIGSTWKLNPVYTVQSDFDRSRTGLRVTKTIWRFDVSALGGRFLRDTMAGFDFDGDIADIGVRGALTQDWTGAGNNFIQAAVGLDYGFPNTLYLAAEYFFNGQGTNNRLTALPFPATAPFFQTAHRHFFGAEARYELTPLWKILLISQTDIVGKSIVGNLETTYSLFSWMDLNGGALFPVGRDAGEFGAVPNLYYLQAQCFF